MVVTKVDDFAFRLVSYDVFLNIDREVYMKLYRSIKCVANPFCDNFSDIFRL